VKPLPDCQLTTIPGVGDLGNSRPPWKGEKRQRSPLK
jgi:hypothetical protein